MFERVLLAVDGSDHSHRAVDLVSGLGGQVKSDVLVLHVREKVATRGGLFDMHEDDEGVADRIAAQLEESGVSARAERFRLCTVSWPTRSPRRPTSMARI